MGYCEVQRHYEQGMAYGARILHYLHPATNPSDGLNNIAVVRIPPPEDHLQDIKVAKQYRTGWDRNWPRPGGPPWPPNERSFLEAIRLPGYRALDAGTTAALAVHENVRSVRLDLADSTVGPALQRGLQLSGHALKLATPRRGLALVADANTIIPLRYSRHSPQWFGLLSERFGAGHALEIPHGEGLVSMSFALQLAASIALVMCWPSTSFSARRAAWYWAEAALSLWRHKGRHLRAELGNHLLSNFELSARHQRIYDRLL